MLSAGEKKVNGQGAGVLDPKPIRTDQLDYRKPGYDTIYQLPVCDFGGGPEIKYYPDTYLESPHVLWILPEDGVPEWRLSALKTFLLEYRKATYTKEGRPHEVRLPVGLQKDLLSDSQEKKRKALIQGVDWLQNQMRPEEWTDFEESFSDVFEGNKSYPHSIFLPPMEKEKLPSFHPFAKHLIALDPSTDNGNEIFRNVQSSRNNFDFTSSNILAGDSAKRYHLCRNGGITAEEDAKDTTRGTKVYAAVRNAYLENKGQKIAAQFSKAIGFPKLTYQQRVLLPGETGMTLERFYYENGYDDASAELYLQTVTLADLYQIRAYIKQLSQSEKFTEDEIKQINTSMLAAVAALEEQEKIGQEQQFWMKWGSLGGVTAAVVSTLVIAGLHVYGLMKQGGLTKVNPKDFLTEKKPGEVKNPNYARIILDAEIEDVINQIRASTLKTTKPHVVLTGPSGGGKDLIAAEVEHRAVMGKIPHLKGKKIFKVDAGGVASAGAVWAGLIDKVLEVVKKKFKTENGIFRVSELQNLLDTGRSSSSSTGALRKLLTMLEDTDTKSVFIGTTSEWPKILAEVPDLDRRVTPIDVPSPTFEKVLNILEKSKDRFLAKGRQGTVTLETDALKAIVHFSKLRAGSENAIALETLDLLAAQASDRKTSNMGELNITLDDVFKIAKNDAQKLGIHLDRDTFDTALQFFNQNPNLEKGVFQFKLEQLQLSSNKNVPQPGPKPPPPPPAAFGGGPTPPAAGAGGAGGTGGTGGGGNGDNGGNGGSVARISLADKFSEWGNSATQKLGEMWHAIDPLKGTAGILGAFVAADVAEHYGVITQAQKEKGGLTLMAGAALLNPGMLVHAVTQFLPSEATAWASTGLAKATGLETFKEGGLGNKVTRTVGNFVGGEAVVYGVGVRGAVKSGAALKEAAGLQSWVRGNEVITQWGADKIGAVYNTAGRPFEKQVAVAANMRNAMVNGIRSGVTQTVQTVRTQVPQLIQSARTFIPNARAALAAGGAAMISGEAAMAAAPGFASVAAMGAIASGGAGLLGGYTLGTLADNALNNFSEENKLGTALDLGTFDLPSNAPEKYKRGNWKFISDE